MSQAEASPEKYYNSELRGLPWFVTISFLTTNVEIILLITKASHTALLVTWLLIIA